MARHNSRQKGLANGLRSPRSLASHETTQRPEATTRVELDQVESNAAGDRVDCLSDGLELGRLAQCGAQFLVLRVVAAEIPDPSVIDIGRAKPSAHIPNNNVGVSQSRMQRLRQNPATAIAVLQARTKREG